MAHRKVIRRYGVRLPALHPSCCAKLRWAFEPPRVSIRLGFRTTRLFGSRLRCGCRRIVRIPDRQTLPAGLRLAPTAWRMGASSCQIRRPTTGLYHRRHMQCQLYVSDGGSTTVNPSWRRLGNDTLNHVIHLDVAIPLAPVQPCLGHFSDTPTAFRRHWPGSCYLLQCSEPVAPLGAHSIENQRHRRLTHADDFL